MIVQTFTIGCNGVYCFVCGELEDLEPTIEGVHLDQVRVRLVDDYCLHSYQLALSNIMRYSIKMDGGLKYNFRRVISLREVQLRPSLLKSFLRILRIFSVYDSGQQLGGLLGQSLVRKSRHCHYSYSR